MFGERTNVGKLLEVLKVLFRFEKAYCMRPKLYVERNLVIKIVEEI